MTTAVPDTAQPSGSLADLLCALSFASDVGMGQSMQHGLKSAYLGLQLAEAAGASAADRQAAFYGALVKDAGCTACAPVFATLFAGDDVTPKQDCVVMDHNSVRGALSWFWRYAEGAPLQRVAGLLSFAMECRSVMRESMTTHCEVSELFARRFGLPQAAQQAVRFAWERWDGKGLAYRLRGDEIPPAARIIHLAQVMEVAFSLGGREAAQAVARERAGTAFDPALASDFLALSSRPAFWSPVAGEGTQAAILDMRPEAPFDRLSPGQADTICEVLADFADVKARSTWNHSRSVAEIAEGIGEAMGLDGEAQAALRRAALVHDLGKAAVPVGILERIETLSSAEEERFRLHPYYTERVLARIEPLSDLAADAAAHHETLDGDGYHRGLGAPQLSLRARILATADAYATRAGAGEEDAASVLEALRPLAGNKLDPACVEALAGALGDASPRPRGRSQHAAGLTDREVEVVQLLTEGLGNRQIAKRLVISEKTVEHHLEHVYNKLGVSTRTAAVVSAMQLGVVP